MRFTHISLAPACRCLVSQKHEIPSSPFPKIQGSHWKNPSISEVFFHANFHPVHYLPNFPSPKSPPKSKSYIISIPKKNRVIKPPGMNWKQSRYRWAKFFTLLLLVIFDILQFTLTADFLGRLDGERWGHILGALNGEKWCVFLMVKGWVNGGE